MKQIYIFLLASVIAFLLLMFVPAKEYSNTGSGGREIGWPIRISVETQNDFGQVSLAMIVIKYLWVFVVNFVLFLVIIEIIMWLKSVLI